MPNNRYSIIINGARYGFFHSTKGLKQGDPLSPALFIIGAEVLSKLLNGLYQNTNFHGFYMEKRGPQINHVSSADDIIIFTSGRSKSLKVIMKMLSTYENVSNQLINKRNSYFIIPENAFRSTAERVNRITGFMQKKDPFTYLGCLIYIRRQRVIYFSDMVSKVVARISGWQSMILSFGGKGTLAKHVLYSLPIHLLCPFFLLH